MVLCRFGLLLALAQSGKESLPILNAMPPRRQGRALLALVVLASNGACRKSQAWTMGDYVGNSLFMFLLR